MAYRTGFQEFCDLAMADSNQGLARRVAYLGRDLRADAGDSQRPSWITPSIMRYRHRKSDETTTFQERTMKEAKVLNRRRKYDFARGELLRRISGRDK